MKKLTFNLLIINLENIQHISILITLYCHCVFANYYEYNNMYNSSLFITIITLILLQI